MIIFGGNLGSSCANDTWVLIHANGIGATPTWTQLTPTGGPPAARLGHNAVYDQNNNRMIVFGGGTCAGSQFFNDVWILSNANGSGGTPAWTQLSPAGTPPAARKGAAAVYDVNGNRMIVFGGIGTGSSLNDVWILSNANGLGSSSLYLVAD